MTQKRRVQSSLRHKAELVPSSKFTPEELHSYASPIQGKAERTNTLLLTSRG